jgi:paraquat-inducible protein B
VVFFQGSVSGLAVGAPVTFRGVQVGSVQRISLRLDAKDMTARIPVYLDLQPDAVSLVNGNLAVGNASFDRLLEAGLKAQLNTTSFVTGQLQVDLDLRPDIKVSPIGSDKGVPEIPAIPSQLDAVKDQIAALHLPELVDSSKRMLTSIQWVSDQLGDKIGPFIDNVQKTSDSARETLQAATETVRQLRTDSARTLGDIDQLAVQGRQQLTARGSELSRVLVEATRTAHAAETLMASVNDMTSARSQTRADLESAIRDLAATASSLRNFSREVERNPTTLLTGKAEQ